jgi:hypothetical protein
MEMSGQFHSPAALPPGKASGTHWVRGWVGPRAVLDPVMRKIPRPRRESNPRTPIVQSVAQTYLINKSFPKMKYNNNNYYYNNNDKKYNGDNDEDKTD